ncbi:hypothetical protein HK097_001991, partial [Rhizophlyctis rosea]
MFANLSSPEPTGTTSPPDASMDASTEEDGTFSSNSTESGYVQIPAQAPSNAYLWASSGWGYEGEEVDSDGMSDEEEEEEEEEEANPLARVRRMPSRQNDDESPEDELVALMARVRGVKIAPEAGPVQVGADVDPDAIENLLTHHKDELLHAIHSDIPDYQKRAFDWLRQFVALDYNRAAEILQSEFLQLIGMALQSDVAPQVQAAALRVVSELLAGPSEHATVLVDFGVIPLICTLFKKEGIPMSSKMAIINSLTNIAHDSKMYRDMVIAEDIIPPLMKSLANWVQINDFRSVLTALKCCNKLVFWKDPDWEKLTPLIRGIVQYLTVHPPSVVAEAGEVLQSLFQSGLGTVREVDALITKRLCVTLVGLLWRSRQVEYAKPLLGCIMAICEKKGAQEIQYLVEAHLGPMLASCICTLDDAARIPALSIVANILRYKRFIEKIIQYNIFDFMARLIQHDPSATARKEACWAFSNALAFRMPEVVSGLTCLRIVPLLVNFMGTCYNSDMQAALRAIESVNHVLVTGELFKSGGAAHRGATNPYADEMMESKEEIKNLMTLWCAISGMGIEGLETEEELVGEEEDEEDDEEEERDELGHFETSQNLKTKKGRGPLRERVAGRIRK